MPDEPRRHPDIFTKAEAAEYLRLPNDDGIDRLREKQMLVGFQFGREFLYHRSELDALVDELARPSLLASKLRDEPKAGPRLKRRN